MNTCSVPSNHDPSPVRNISPLSVTLHIAGVDDIDLAVSGVSPEELMLRSEWVCIGNMGHPSPSGRGGIVETVTNALVHVSKAIIFKLFERRRSEVRWLSETRDGAH